MGKKSKKQNNQQPTVGISLGFKHLAKPISLAFAVYDTDVIEPVFKQNSEEFQFESLPPSPELVLTWDSLVKDQLNNIGVGKSLGLVYITAPNALETTETGGLFIPGETLPFKLGENRFWRNPKMGTLLAEDDDEPNVLARKELKEQFDVLFPNFDGIYTIEQVVDPAGISDSLDLVLGKKVLSLLS